MPIVPWKAHLWRCLDAWNSYFFCFGIQGEALKQCCKIVDSWNVSRTWNVYEGHRSCLLGSQVELGLHAVQVTSDYNKHLNVWNNTFRRYEEEMSMTSSFKSTLLLTFVFMTDVYTVLIWIRYTFSYTVYDRIFPLPVYLYPVRKKIFQNGLSRASL